LVEVVVEGQEVDIVEKAREKDKKVVRIVKKIKKTEVKILKDNKYHILTNLI